MRSIVRSFLVALFAIIMAMSTRPALAQGDLYLFGDNSYGQLGDGTRTNRDTPVKLDGLSGVKKVAASQRHCIALKSDGTVWGWGDNRGGELGIGGSLGIVPGAVQTVGLTNVIDVAAGNGISYALKSDGTVWSWGGNGYGNFGDGTAGGFSAIPVPATLISDIIAISAGGGHVLALKADGTVWAWGQNDSGELGRGTINNSGIPQQVIGLTGVRSISAGSTNSYAVKSDGTLWAWGSNASGQIGNGTQSDFQTFSTPVQVAGISTAVAVAGGPNHVIALLSDGTLQAWGNNSFGELGNGGYNSGFYVPAPVLGLTGVKAIAAGQWSSLALTSDGLTWAWGLNDAGEVGPAGPYRTVYPVQVPTLPGIAGIAAGNSFSVAWTRQGTTRSKLVLSAASGSIGKSVTLSATLTDDVTHVKLAGRPVQFSIDGTNYGPPAITGSNGQAKYMFVVPETMTITQHTTAANFAGDGVYFSSVGGNTLTIAKGTPKLTLAAATGHAGDTVKLIATLKTPLNVLMVGKPIQFSILGFAIGTPVNTDLSGQAILSYVVPDGFPAISADTAAAFSGDAIYGTASASNTLTITKRSVTLGLVADGLRAGGTATLGASFKDPITGYYISGKPIQFSVEGVNVGAPVNTDAFGNAFCDYPVPIWIALGPLKIAANFAGDTVYTPASREKTFTVARSVVRVKVERATALYGDWVTLTATLTDADSHAGLAEHRLIEFNIGGIIKDAYTEANGVATIRFLSGSTFPVGGYKVTASYFGGADYLPGSDVNGLTISKLPVSITVPTVTGQAGATVILSATAIVTYADGHTVALSGVSLAFHVAGSHAGSATTDGTGTATRSYTIPAGTATGDRIITVIYAGDSTHLAASGVGNLQVRR